MLDHRNRRVLFLAVCALGVSAFITQLTLMRELLCVFSGNELIFGIVLGNWLLLTGIGSSLGRIAPRLTQPILVLVIAQVLVALLPIADVFLVRVLRNVVFTRGEVIGPIETVVSCLVLLAPYCLVAGFLLTLASLILAAGKGPTSIGQVYFLDNVGDIIGGVLFSFVLVWLFGHFDILYFPALVNLLLAGLVAWRFGRRALAGAVVAVAAGLACLIATCDLDDLSTRIQHADRRIATKASSPYGSLIVTESSGQYNFLHNGVPLFSTHNVEEVEETVHFAMAQRPEARRVLLISGGVSGTAKEILKYGDPAENLPLVDYVEVDPLILRMAEKPSPDDDEPLRALRQFLFDSLDDRRIRVIHADGRRFVRQTERRYDVVLVDVPDPSTSQLNRFYTREFFGEVGRRLARDGVLSISLGTYANRVSPQLARLIAVAHRTLREQFEHVLIIPAERTGRIFYLASDGPLTTDIAERIEKRQVPTELMHRGYLRVALSPGRMADVRSAVSDDAPVNEDFNPILYYYDLLYWMSQFQVSFGILEGGLLVVLVLCLVRIRPVPLAIFTTGLAASALEVVLLVGFQILYGYVYHQIGVIITMFMVGLGVGSFMMNRMLPGRSRRDLARLELGVALLSVCVPVVLMGLGRIGNPVASAVAAQVVVPLLAMLLAMMVGLEFPLAGKADFHGVASTAARLYTADYVGAALGALLVSTLLIPVMGVMAVCLLAAVLNVVSGAVIFWTSRE
ncbi:MAG: fused MFS/spermidine synthase [Planctomycetota bacterium]|jgi:spermidine synthase